MAEGAEVMSNFKANTTMFPKVEFDFHERENLQLHPLCTVFPEMNEGEYDSLVESMQEQGFLEIDPIVVINLTDGKEADDYQILDGRNRHLAALDAGADPIYVEYIGKDAAGFVVSRNTDRRHLTAGQKAAIASKIATVKFGNNQFTKAGETTREEAAKVLQTSTKSIQRFRFVEKNNPELAEEIAKGEVTLGEAEKMTKQYLGDKEREEAKANREPAEPTTAPLSASSPSTGASAPTPEPEASGEAREEPEETTEYHRRPRTIIRQIVDKYSDRRLDIGTLELMVTEAFEAGHDWEGD